MTTQLKDYSKSDKELIRFSISGKNPEQWKRLSQSLYKLIDVIADKLSKESEINGEHAYSNSDMAKDIASIASEWAKAKIERPSIENDNIKAETALKFAQAKKHLTEIRKIEEEIIGQRIENRNRELNFLLEKFERLMKMIQIIEGAHVEFVRSDNDACLLIGPKPDELTPSGDDPK